MHQNEAKLLECVAYFKERPAFHKLFAQVREKYASLGHFGGKVVLLDLTPEEKQQLGGFFRKDYADKSKVIITVAQMEKALSESRFFMLDWEQILELYFGRPLLIKKEQQQLKLQEKEEFFEHIIAAYEHKMGGQWLARVLEHKGKGYQLLMHHYESKEALESVLCQTLEALEELPVNKQQGKRNVLLAVFAAMTTGNPHFFDEGTVAEKLLTLFLQDMLDEELKSDEPLAREKMKLYEKAGILRADVSNDVLVYGIRAKNGRGDYHAGIEGFLKMQEPVRLTLLTVSELEAAFAQCGHLVYVVENPAVFSVLIKKYPDAAVICGNGQLRLAVLALMDLFDNETIFCYAGDFDPEGLQIAQRLKKRYQKRLCLWNYNVELYHKYLSDVTLNSTRLKKLDTIDVEELSEIKRAMLLAKKAVYQETMLSEYVIETEER